MVSEDVGCTCEPPPPVDAAAALTNPDPDPPPHHTVRAWTRIRVDTRERALHAHLVSAAGDTADVDVRVEVSALPLGDVEVSSGISGRTTLIERKTLADLAASVRDGRWVEQRARLSVAMAAGGATISPLLVVETEGAWAWDDRLRSPSGILPASLQGAVLSAVLSSAPTRPVIFTRDPRDTAALIRRLARRSCANDRRRGAADVAAGDTQERAYEDVACQAAVAAAAVTAGAPKRGALLTPRLCLRQQLCMVPGVSPRLAGALLDAYIAEGAPASTCAWVRAVEANAGISDGGDVARALRRVPGIGAKTAANLVTYVWGAAAP